MALIQTLSLLPGFSPVNRLIAPPEIGDVAG